ncbi:helix-turn-helix domain-containing protein [Sphaerisporangium corydalis]|uniref:Helix-turn-helix domain-containing protein n=1 Tax=Sphaerisporangium corydalis TaxID=1441875 RepID=A0ABV9EFI5_9ACTN|nr:helix-turn-helix transcriptional regulator [Sphaerisporangium corydalis]
MTVEQFPDPGSPRVPFGTEMRRLREAAQLSQAAVATRLGCTQTQVSRLIRLWAYPERGSRKMIEEAKQQWT